jgi:hypothetical protein
VFYAVASWKNELIRTENHISSVIPCGIQLFVRRKRGIDLLEEPFRNLDKAELPFTVHARNLHEIRALIKEIDGVKNEINKIGWFDGFS